MSELVELGKRSAEVEEEESKSAEIVALSVPKKKFFRSRAHCNPLSHNDSFAYPRSPEDFLWQDLYPGIATEDRVVRFLDMGMGFGGLTVKLAELFPQSLVLGMEIRAKVTPPSCSCPPSPSLFSLSSCGMCIGLRICAAAH